MWHLVSVFHCRMAKVFPSEFNFIPRTWILPSEYTALQTYSLESKKRRKKVKAFIIKPANGAMGNGFVRFLFSYFRFRFQELGRKKAVSFPASECTTLR